MPSTTILLSIGIIAISFIVGVGIYYIISTEPNGQKKKQIENVVSLTINFVIYIWIGKIVVNFFKFVKDPLSILAYPSNSYAFYIASLLVIINLLYRKYRHHEQIAEIVYTFIPILLVSSFMYEFLQVVIQNQSYNKYYLLFVTLLTVSYLIVYGKIPLRMQSYLFGLILLFGQLVLTAINSVTIFNYRLAPYYFIVMIVIVLLTIVFRHKRKV